MPEAEHVHATRLVSSTVTGFVVLESTGAFDHSDPEPDESWERVIDVLDQTLRRWTTPPPTSV